MARKLDPYRETARMIGGLLIILTQRLSTVAGFESERGTLAVFIPTSAGLLPPI
jgi:hypothetical protein